MSLSKSESLDGVSLGAMSVDASINSKTCHDKETLVKLLSLPSPNRMAPRMSELNLRPSNVKHAGSICVSVWLLCLEEFFGARISRGVAAEDETDPHHYFASKGPL